MISRMQKKLKGGFTLIELMIVVAIIGVLAAVAIPAFMKYIRKSKTTEAVVNMKKLYEGARSYFMDESNGRASITPLAKQFPRTTPGGTPVPPLVTCCSAAGDKCPPNPALWTDATWQALKFGMDDPSYYSYQYRWNGLFETLATYTADSHGDLDCDAIYSTFEMVGSVQPDGKVTGQAGFFRDLELE